MSAGNFSGPGEAERATWLVTGCAGFIGSHIVERLLKMGQAVRGIDNFSSGERSNIDEALKAAGPGAEKRFTLIEGDILEKGALTKAMEGVEIVSHQAALCSVQESIEAPIETVRVNVCGFMSVVKAAADSGARRMVYASSSSVYGDDPYLPKVEEKTGVPISPYAASKRADEIFAGSCVSSYGLELVGLRYFNIFGPRQGLEGPYAAVIPAWITSLMRGEEIVIHGDPDISRDFAYVGAAADANILASREGPGDNEIYNIASGEKTSLAGLAAALGEVMTELGVISAPPAPIVGQPRPGDIQFSQADISKAASGLGYSPRVGLKDGLKKTAQWYMDRYKR